jgi:hypothetical protein
MTPTESADDTSSVDDNKNAVQGLAGPTTTAPMPLPILSQQNPTSNHDLPVPPLLNFDFADDNIVSASNWLMMDNIDFSAFELQPPPSSGLPLSSGPALQHHDFATMPARSHPAVSRLVGPMEFPISPVSQQSSVFPDTGITAFDESSSRTGEFFVDTDAARAPHAKRRKLSSGRKRVEVPGAWNPFSLRIHALPDATKDQAFTIGEDAWDEMNGIYLRLCIEPRHAQWLAFEPITLPSRQAFGHLVNLYYTHFDQVLPFWHQAFIHEAEQRPILTLTMAAIGSHYLEQAHGTPLSSSLHEFARRWLLFLHESTPEGRERSIHVACAHLLHIVGMAYCGDESYRLRARQSRHELIDIFALCCRRIELVLPLPPGAAQGQDDLTEWREWVIEEGTKRLAYCAFFVDGMLACHFSTPPVLFLRDCCLPLPCEEKLWYARTVQDWRALYDSRTTYMSLIDAMQELYIRKYVAKDRGEFSRILTIHGLFHRAWEVERYYGDPLSHWEPTASRQLTASNLPKSPIWLPSIPAYVKWQNTSCDALDVLQWQANATITQAGGWEHPTVLHLHMARIVLLTPHEEIVKLARAIASGKSPNSEGCVATKQLIQRWAVQQQYKARLAVIHAGATLWHVRRYAINAFYDAPSVAIGALILWAFGTFSSRRSTAQVQNTAQDSKTSRMEGSGEDEGSCGIILVDRPTDAELVQQFIQNGDNMRVHMTGVDDLYGPGGPEGALLQAIKLLGAMKCWGTSTSWLTLLQGLVNVSQRAGQR